jgi:histidyl-tRNA synthetase
MSEIIQAVRGMNDVLPAESAAWQALERAARETFAAYGYREIRVPLLERTELFKRSIGELTDIVEKEMYTFDDRGGESLTLRPEATAGIVRASITNGLLHNQRQKVWCMGPMFRYERPQKGRYRQFHQIDVEALGFAGPDVDAELIMLSARLWRRVGLRGLVLNLNSLGTPESRKVYRARLVEYFRSHESSLDADSLRRLEGNPMRILDSKNPAMRAVVAGAPLITDHLDPESSDHFVELMRLQGLVEDGAAPDVYLVLAGPAAEAAGLQLAESLRDAVPGLRIEANCGGGSFKSQLKRADRSGARCALILGDDEVARQVATLKPLREDAGQKQVALDGLAAELAPLPAARGGGQE